ncbi:YbhB/YbcL family Raf kinase inhibitor-like protein [Echinicola sediminis]
MRKNTLIISSTKIGPDKFIPADYTYDGKNVNPPLQIKNIPTKAKSLVVIMKDIEMEESIHWLAYNIPATGLVRENETKCETGLNGFNIKEYSGPNPHGRLHKYVFKVYALDDYLYFHHQNVGLLDIEEGIRYHLVGYGELKGVYERILDYHLV